MSCAENRGFIDYRGNNLETAMNKTLNEVGFGIRLRIFETVSKDNVVSYRSALRQQCEGGEGTPELYLEILP